MLKEPVIMRHTEDENPKFFLKNHNGANILSGGLQDMRVLSFCLILLFLVFPSLGMISADDTNKYARLRQQMVNHQIIGRGVKDRGVLKAMRKVPRHEFVPDVLRGSSYGDYPLPIGEGQTISQPYIVAFMTEALGLLPEHKVLEIGTGSGYQAAILAQLVKEVYTIEIIEVLGNRAKKTLDRLAYKNVFVKIGDGYKGWPEKAPFDAVIVTAAPEKIPPALVHQLKEGGRMIIPVGRVGSVQKLVRGTKKHGTLVKDVLLAVRFVPMVKGDD
jgi:protein-L-isoaspartate(D-aspartate) O-methyltransferase